MDGRQTANAVLVSALGVATLAAIGLTCWALTAPPLWILAAPLDVAVVVSWSAVADMTKPGGWLGSEKEPEE